MTLPSGRCGAGGQAPRRWAHGRPHLADGVPWPDVGQYQGRPESGQGRPRFPYLTGGPGPDAAALGPLRRFDDHRAVPVVLVVLVGAVGLGSVGPGSPVQGQAAMGEPKPTERSSRADAGVLSIRLDAPPRIHEGDRFEVRIEVRRSPAARPHPLLLTPETVGPAVEVVRGRLLPDDADAPGAEPAVFRLPCVARSRGTAILRVEARGYACPPGDDPDAPCREVVAVATARLHVDRPPEP